LNVPVLVIVIGQALPPPIGVACPSKVQFIESPLNVPLAVPLSCTLFVQTAENAPDPSDPEMTTTVH
jgi:hypothetical protein